jgi:hypothetical protein
LEPYFLHAPSPSARPTGWPISARASPPAISSPRRSWTTRHAS